MQIQSTFQTAHRADLRTLRKILDTVLPLVGVACIIGAVLFIQEVSGQIAVVTLGILLLEVGIWKLAHQLLPGERTYLTLRTEVDQFIALVRGLNEAAIRVKAHNEPEYQQAFEEIKATMHQTVERMAQVAGKTEAELAYVQKKAAAKGVAPRSTGGSASTTLEPACSSTTHANVANDK